MSFLIKTAGRLTEGLRHDQAEGWPIRQFNFAIQNSRMDTKVH